MEETLTSVWEISMCKGVQICILSVKGQGQKSQDNLTRVYCALPGDLPELSLPTLNILVCLLRPVFKVRALAILESYASFPWYLPYMAVVTKSCVTLLQPHGL